MVVRLVPAVADIPATGAPLRGAPVVSRGARA